MRLKTVRARFVEVEALVRPVHQEIVVLDGFSWGQFRLRQAHDERLESRLMAQLMAVGLT